MKLLINTIILTLLFTSCVQKQQENEQTETVDTREQYEASLAKLDSVLTDLQTQQQKLLKNFYIEDEKATVPVFIHKNQRTSWNYERAFVRAHATKNGDLYLSSHYVGQGRIGHNRILLTCGETSVESDSITNDALNHSFENDGFFYEIVKFKKNRDLAEFIAQNYNQKIALTFVGEKRKYKTYLSETDKKSIHEAFLLANSFKESLEIQAQITNLQAVLNN